MIFIFANEWFFDDIFNLYDFHEKQNIEYSLAPMWALNSEHGDMVMPFPSPHRALRSIEHASTLPSSRSTEAFR